jgi:hypothetical protein
MRPAVSTAGPAFVLVAAVAAVGGACGSSDSSSTTANGLSGPAACSSTTPFPASALTTLTSDQGKLAIILHSAPYQPLIVGLQCVELVVTDPSTGAGIDGLAITMTPWMPAMGHGTSVTPLLTPLGQGRYVFTDVSLFMPGVWELRTQFSGPVEDSVDPTFHLD